MAKPTCGDCIDWIDGKCGDGGKYFDFSNRRYAGQPRRFDAQSCHHYRGHPPPFFFVGGIVPASVEAPAWNDGVAELRLPPNRATRFEALESRPFLLTQAREIRALLTQAASATNAPPQRIDEAFARIREAAERARWLLRIEWNPQGPQPKYQLMTELARVGERGHLSDEPRPELVLALLYGAQAAGVLDLPVDQLLKDDPTEYPRHGLALLRTFSADALRRAAEQASDGELGLRGSPGRPESKEVRRYVQEVVTQYARLSGKRGTPVSRGKRALPGGPLVNLVLLCLAPVQPMGAEGVAALLKRVRSPKS